MGEGGRNGSGETSRKAAQAGPGGDSVGAGEGGGFYTELQRGNRNPE